MSNPSADIEAQLDALSAEANTGEQDVSDNPPPSPPASDPHPTAEPDAAEAEAAEAEAAEPSASDPAPADLAGEAFAEQVQRLLDEAAAKGQLSDSDPPSADADDQADDDPDPSPQPSAEPQPAAEPAADAGPPADGESVDAGSFETVDEAVAAPAPAPAAAAAPAADAEPSQGTNLDDDALMQQIDSMLAEHADQALEGDFASMDELTDDAEDASASSPASEWAAGQAVNPEPNDQTAAAPSESADDSTSDVEGDFESVESLDGGGSADDPAKGADPAELTPAAQALAEELDADEAQTQRGREAPRSQTAASDSDAAAATTPQAEPPQQDPDHAPRLPAKVGRVALRGLGMINQPLMGLAPLWREVVGLIGLGTLAWAVVLMVKALAGTLAATISAAAILPAVAVVAVRLLLRADDEDDAADLSPNAADDSA